MEATESVYILRVMLRAGQLAGIDPGVVCEAIHLDQATLDDPDARVSMEMEKALWAFLAEQSGDDCFGLHAALTLEPGEFDVMDYAIRTSQTLRQALENASRYNRLLHDVAEFELTDDGKAAHFYHYFRGDPKGASWHASDFTLASIYTTGLALTGKNWAPIKVGFQHAEPENLSEYKKVFPCKLEFNCARNVLEFDASVLDYPVLSSDPALNIVLTRHADDMLAKLPKADEIVEKVREQLVVNLREGDAGIEAIAEKLHITPRTLQRRLKEEGTSHKELSDEMRKGLAAHYLQDNKLGVSEIAYLLGYSEPSAFHRAFKRWFGTTPADYRTVQSKS